MTIPLYEPLNTLKKIDTDIWIVDGGIIKMNVLAFGVPFSTRMTIVKLKNQSLWVHSPIKPDEKLLTEIDKLGEVTHLISPNRIHYAYIAEWKTHYPKATAWSSPGVEKRAQSQNIKVDFDRPLENEAPADWSADINQLIFKGSRTLEEVVFFHKGSKTLILTDLIENFEPARTTNRFWKTVYKLAGVADPNGKAPIDLRLTFFGQKEKARHCYKRMLSWQPEKIILAHGRWYDKNGTAELKRAFSWLEK
ncbi:DUF4336 domain-containing protein [Alkalibacterium sp. f15]|uniref:DUF4336 domain-containing protein n=1 Tax=Alkalibacterium sp. f15 TaxID=3414029 RepID=UPI003BF91A37